MGLFPDCPPKKRLKLLIRESADLDFFTMTAEQAVAEYARPGLELDCLKWPCRKSAFQLLDNDPLAVEISEGGGTEFPDFILHLGVIPLVSERLKQVFLALELNNLLYKPIDLVCSYLGLCERYWLALPPRIDCLDWRACVLEEDSDPTCGFWARLHRVRKIVIDDSKVGHYRIFKLPVQVLNQEIIVTRDVKIALEKGNFRNLYFYPADTEQV